MISFLFNNFQHFFTIVWVIFLTNIHAVLDFHQSILILFIALFMDFLGDVFLKNVVISVAWGLACLGRA